MGCTAVSRTVILRDRYVGRGRRWPKREIDPVDSQDHLLANQTDKRRAIWAVTLDVEPRVR